MRRTESLPTTLALLFLLLLSPSSLQITASCLLDSVTSTTTCRTKCATYEFISNVQFNSNNGQVSCSCSGANLNWIGEFDCRSTAATVYPQEVSGGGGDGDGDLPSSSSGCVEFTIISSSQCQLKCATFDFGNVDYTSSNGKHSCSCSGGNAAWVGRFACSPASATVLPIAADALPACSEHTITDIDTTFCRQLNDACLSQGGLGVADVGVEGGTYRCRLCSTSGVVVEIPLEEIEAAASAGDVNVSGPIFGMFVGLAVGFRVMSLVVAKCMGGEKKASPSNDDGAVLNVFVIDKEKEKENGETKTKTKTKTCYDVGLLPYPPTPLNCSLWYLKLTGLVSPSTNTPRPFLYYLCNYHELLSLFKGDPALLSTALRWRSFVFTFVAAYALSRVFASANFGVVRDGTCDYACLDPSSCSTSTTTLTGEAGEGEVNMDWRAALLATVCGKIVAMGGMDAYIDALHEMTINGDGNKCKSWTLSIGIEAAWLAILSLCLALERLATEGSDVDEGVKSELYLTVAATTIGLDSVTSVVYVVGQWAVGGGVWSGLPGDYKEETGGGGGGGV